MTSKLSSGPHDQSLSLEQRARTADLVQGVALANLLFLLSVFVLAFITFRLGMGVAPWILYLAILPWGFGVWYFSPSREIALRTFGWSLAINLLALGTSWLMYDYTWDGLWYHEEAVLRLAEGWNPITGDAKDYGSGSLWSVPLWLNHYPQAAWIIGACVFKSLGAIEPGKFLNLTLMTSAGCQVAAALLRLTSLRAGIVTAIAIVAALNPTAVVELSSFTVDGMLASLLTLLIVGGILYVARPGLPVAVVLMSAVCLLIDMKFTGLVYAVLFSGFGVGACLALRRWRAGLGLAAALGVVGVLSLLVLGCSSYVRNYTEDGNLFYPLMGKGAVDIMTNIRPRNLAGKDRFSRFVIANFSRSQEVNSPDSSRLKFPLVIYPSEFRVWRTNGPEAGGLGPWFGALLLCVLAAMGLLVSDPKMRRLGMICGAITGCILVTVFIHAEGWLARYAPQTWLIPLVWMVGLLECASAGRRNLGRVMLGMMTANMLFVLAAWIGWNVLYEWRVHKSLREMAALKPPVAVDFGIYQSLRERLREAGIQYVVVHPPPAPPDTKRRRMPTNGEQAYWYEPITDSTGAAGK